MKASSGLLTAIAAAVAYMALSGAANASPGASRSYPATMSRAQVLALARRFWPTDQANIAATVAMRESSGITGNRNPDGEDSRGLWQLNVKSKTRIPSIPNWRKLDLYNPEINARVAYELWKLEGWNPWTTAKQWHT